MVPEVECGHEPATDKSGFKGASQMWKMFSTQCRRGRVAPCLEEAGKDMETSGQHAKKKKY